MYVEYDQINAKEGLIVDAWAKKFIRDGTVQNQMSSLAFAQVSLQREFKKLDKNFRWGLAPVSLQRKWKKLAKEFRWGLAAFRSSEIAKDRSRYLSLQQDPANSSSRFLELFLIRLKEHQVYKSNKVVFSRVTQDSREHREP